MTAARVGAASDRGVVRQANEDSYLVAEAVFAVADGMGGHAAGDVASELAVAALAEVTADRELTEEVLRKAVSAANDAIRLDGRKHPIRAGMGTTLTGLALVSVAGSPHWLVFNVGDSRVYRWWDGELTRLTVDHSEVEALVGSGELTLDEASRHPLSNVVTRALGTHLSVEPDVWVFPPTPGERFLLCSDGLTLELTHERIAAVLGAEDDPQRAADTLVAEAVEAGGRDNVTVVVVDVPPSAAEPDGATVPRGER
ncbi:MAG TPA: protein phosphatase 2C domain-containing protein [Pseudonocardiaceae bacterium]